MHTALSWLGALYSCKFLNVEENLFLVMDVEQEQVEIYDAVCTNILPRENETLVTTSLFTSGVNFDMHGKLWI